MNARQTLNDLIEMLNEYKTYQERLNLLLPNDVDLCKDKHISTYLAICNTIELIKEQIKEHARANAIEIDII